MFNSRSPAIPSNMNKLDPVIDDLVSTLQTQEE